MTRCDALGLRIVAEDLSVRDVEELVRRYTDEPAVKTTKPKKGKKDQPKDTPLALVESATLPERRVLRGTLADLPKLARKTGAGPAVVLLGEVLNAAFAESAAAPIEEIEIFLRRA